MDDLQELLHWPNHSTGHEDYLIFDEIYKHEFFEAFNLSFYQNFKQHLLNQNDSKVELLSYIKSYVQSCGTRNMQLEILASALAPLMMFIQKNWTGPDINVNNDWLSVTFSVCKNDVVNELVLDGESIIPAVQMPELLYLTEAILEIAYKTFEKSYVIKLWYLRCLFIHQQILEELSPLIFEKLCTVIKEIKYKMGSLSEKNAVALHLEFAEIYLYFCNIQKSKEDIQEASKLGKIKITLSGALGKRTKFQSEDLAQLIAKIEVDAENNLKSQDEVCSYPVDVKLNDDVRLDKVKYTVSDLNEYPKVTALEQGVILGTLFQTKKSQPQDSLADEELLPLIRCILDDPKVWSIRTSTLLMRSKLEANHKRTVERSMMQIQALVDEMKEVKVSFQQRLKYFFISYLPPKWNILKMLADILVSTGLIKSALEIYTTLEDWENVINCYIILQMRRKAQEIIEQQLKKVPSPKLWCLLGDATDDVNCYEKAWEMSNKRSARSQRHWALFYYHRNNYSESLEHFQESLDINSLQKDLWYKYGYAALMEEKWETSAMAYRRYVVLDNECFEAWNNLARCYCELKQKTRAWKALQEALKVDFSNWKVWDNYMVVSSDLKMFDEVIKSYHEILNIKEKHLDIPVITSLVGGLKNLEADSENHENYEKLKKKLLTLFGRITSQVINDPELWFLYSEVVDTNTIENIIKKHQLLLKAYRSDVNKLNWEKSLKSCNRVTHIVSKLVELGLQIKKSDVLLSCKLAATGALKNIKKEYPDMEINESLLKNLELIEEILNP